MVAQFLIPQFGLEFVSLAVLLIVAVTVAAARSAEDPQGHRLPAAYLAVVLFFSLFLTVFSATSGFSSLMDLIGDDDVEAVDDYEYDDSFGPDDLVEPPGFAEDDFEEDDDEEGTEDEVGGAVLGFLTAAVAGAAFEYHRRKAVELVDSEGFRDGPGRQVFTGYLYAAAFVAVLGVIGGGASALEGVAKVLVPGALEVGEVSDIREAGARQAFTGAFLAVLSGLVVTSHLGRRHWLATAPPPPPEPEPVETELQ
jgi:hypothetical protein